MGARQSKRSVDITTTPKKGDGEVSPVGEEKIEQLADADVKAVVTNGTATHTDIEFADKDEEPKENEEKPTTDIKENGLPESSEGEKTPDNEPSVPAAGDQPKTEEVATEKPVENGEKVTETPDPKKQKEKKKKKWSLRSISFSKKDKSKPSKEKDKNGEVEELNEEKTEETASSPLAESSKTEESKAEETTPVTNGDASKEELVASVPEAVEEVKPSEEVKKPEEPTTVAPVASEIAEKTPEAPPKVEECIKPVVEETKKTEEIVAAPAVVEETKEIISPEPATGEACEISQSTGDTTAESAEPASATE